MQNRWKINDPIKKEVPSMSASQFALYIRTNQSPKDWNIVTSQTFINENENKTIKQVSVTATKAKENSIYFYTDVTIQFSDAKKFATFCDQIKNQDVLKNVTQESNSVEMTVSISKLKKRAQNAFILGKIQAYNQFSEEMKNAIETLTYKPYPQNENYDDDHKEQMASHKLS